LAASRSRDSRVAESARELMPSRYPYVYEFRQALEVDSKNVDLRREFAYLLLEMGKREDAEQEFRQIVDLAPDDLLSAAQLGFLRLGRKDITGAMPLLERVMQGDDDELASRVRSALKLPPALCRRGEVSSQKAAEEAKQMAARSFEKGYLKDALKYLTTAHESDPVDFSVILKLGWTNNLLQQDRDALRWFSMARKSPDPAISAEAAKAYGNLRPAFARVRTTAWLFPFYSSRWHDVFSYGQIKTEFRIGRLPFRPYLSTRFAGDTRRTLKVGEAQPQLLSESAFIFSLGLATNYWKGLMAWTEAGTSVGYLRRSARPDYRGGLAYGKGFGHLLGGEASGPFFETNADAVFVSRFGNDTLFYSQNRAGYTFAPIESFDGLQLQLLWNQNATTDTKRQYWANVLETGPGIRFRWQALPPAVSFSLNALRGRNYVNQGNPRSPSFSDFRAGVWYAITH
jgi:tetratricopeptide (TPR) repeat protein